MRTYLIGLYPISGNDIEDFCTLACDADESVQVRQVLKDAAYEHICNLNATGYQMPYHFTLNDIIEMVCQDDEFCELLKRRGVNVNVEDEVAINLVNGDETLVYSDLAEPYTADDAVIRAQLDSKVKVELIANENQDKLLARIYKFSPAGIEWKSCFEHPLPTNIPTSASIRQIANATSHLFDIWSNALRKMNDDVACEEAIKLTAAETGEDKTNETPSKTSVNALRYNNLTFIPYRNFRSHEQQIREMSNYLESDIEHKVLSENFATSWNWNDFYQSAQAQHVTPADIFYCVEAGRLVTPCKNELFFWTRDIDQFAEALAAHMHNND